MTVVLGTQPPRFRGVLHVFGRVPGTLPKATGGEGATVFWTTGACLFKYRQNKEKAAEYMKSLTFNDGIWKDSISGSPTSHPGQIPPYQSFYDKWNKSKSTWWQD